MVNLDLGVRELRLVLKLISNAASGYYTDLTNTEIDLSGLIYDSLKDALDEALYMRDL